MIVDAFDVQIRFKSTPCNQPIQAIVRREYSDYADWINVPGVCGGSVFCCYGPLDALDFIPTGCTTGERSLRERARRALGDRTAREVW